jgi:hypothetical protein
MLIFTAICVYIGLTVGMVNGTLNNIIPICMNKLEVIKFKDGSVIRKSTKKEGWGTVMVAQRSYGFNNGVLNETVRIGFMRAPLAQLEGLVLVAGQDLNAKLSSLGHGGANIVRKESTTPFFEGQTPKINPKTKEVIKDIAGNPIYMQDTLCDLAKGEKDELISSVATAVVAPAGEAGALS